MKYETKVLEILDEKKKLSSHYYDNFKKHLKRGRLSKSSEFLWGAFCSLLYAVAPTLWRKIKQSCKDVGFC